MPKCFQRMLVIEIRFTSVLGINLAEHYYPQEANLFFVVATICINMPFLPILIILCPWCPGWPCCNLYLVQHGRPGQLCWWTGWGTWSWLAKPRCSPRTSHRQDKTIKTQYLPVVLITYMALLFTSVSLTSRVGRRAATAAVAHLGSTVSTWAVRQYLGSTVSTWVVQAVPGQYR